MNKAMIAVGTLLLAGQVALASNWGFNVTLSDHHGFGNFSYSTFPSYRGYAGYSTCGIAPYYRDRGIYPYYTTAPDYRTYSAWDPYPTYQGYSYSGYGRPLFTPVYQQPAPIVVPTPIFSAPVATMIRPTIAIPPATPIVTVPAYGGSTWRPGRYVEETSMVWVPGHYEVVSVSDPLPGGTLRYRNTQNWVPGCERPVARTRWEPGCWE